MIKIGAEVEIRAFNAKGKVVQVDKDGCLVEHLARIDGKDKVVKQWYKKDIVSEVAVKQVKEKKVVEKSEIVLGVIPEEGDTDETKKM